MIGDTMTAFCYGLSVSVWRRSLVDVSLVVHVIQEWDNDLVPAWKAAIGLHGDQVSQPGDVLDLLFLELEVGVEGTVVELLLEGHRELLD